jgi:CheY-like chemotaxis protein
MPRSVLLVEPDVDALGTLASELRSRGLGVTLADGSDRALERARTGAHDAILVSTSLRDHRELVERVHADKAMAELPAFLLVDHDVRDTLSEVHLPRSDADLIARRVYALPPRRAPVAVDRGDFRGDLHQVSLADLLQLLSMNRRTGALTLSTPAGAGELRLVEGEIVDGVYRRLEGEKALYRLLGESEGTFAFASGSPSPLRRIETPTQMLLMEGMRRFDDVRRRRDALTAEHDALLAVEAALEDGPEDERRLLESLTAPRTLDEVLDDVPLGDLEILELLEQMLANGRVRRIPKGAVRVELADPEQMSVLAAVAKRLARGGFSGAPRIVIAGAVPRLATLSHSLRRIADVVAPAESAPAAPVPYVIGTLRLADGVDLDVVGLPLLDAYSPLWSLTLPGALVTIRLDAGSSDALHQLCEVAGVPVLDAAALLGDLDEADPAHVAALVRLSLDTIAGR